MPRCAILGCGTLIGHTKPDLCRIHQMLKRDVERVISQIAKIEGIPRTTFSKLDVDSFAMLLTPKYVGEKLSPDERYLYLKHELSINEFIVLVDAAWSSRSIYLYLKKGTIDSSSVTGRPIPLKEALYWFIFSRETMSPALVAELSGISYRYFRHLVYYHRTELLGLGVENPMGNGLLFYKGDIRRIKEIVDVNIRPATRKKVLAEYAV